MLLATSLLVLEIKERKYVICFQAECCGPRLGALLGKFNPLLDRCIKLWNGSFDSLLLILRQSCWDLVNFLNTCS